MKNKFTTILLACIWVLSAKSQNSSAGDSAYATIFRRISSELGNFRADTTSVPNDKITRKIKELMELKGGFNINGAINFKIEEDRSKNELSKEEMDKLSEFFRNGSGKRWLNNAVIHIYRKYFTYRELKQAVRFYKTSGGKKMADSFPILMLQSLAAAQFIKDVYEQNKNKRLF